jgi:hypothetical protein
MSIELFNTSKGNVLSHMVDARFGTKINITQIISYTHTKKERKK